MSDPIKFRNYLDNFFDKADLKFKEKEGILFYGESSGVLTLDKITGGLESEVIVIAGRPSVGKTAFVTKIANHYSSNNKNALFFSHDNTAEKITLRLLSMNSRIDSHRLRNLFLVDDDWALIENAVDKIKDYNLFIHEEIINIEQIYNASKIWAETNKPDLIIVDHLQLVPSHKPNETRYSNINEIMISLKKMSKEFNCPVILLSQLSKLLEQRADKRPVLSDFLDSDLIAGIADKVIFIYRDEIYSEGTPDIGMAEIIVAKNNNGPIAKFKMPFYGQYSDFDN